VGTANFLRPDFAFRLVEELPPLLERLGVSSWEEFRGGLKA
jgi:dihydroorotate dehydrogenase (NAD+) catalytic subunit